MAQEVIIPRLTHDMETAVILEWYKEDGDAVQKGDPILAVETDKAAVDIEAEAAGRLQGIRFDVDAEVSVGEVVGWILSPGEDLPRVRPGSGETANQRSDGIDRDGESGERRPRAGGRVVASPLAKRIARIEGVDLRELEGSGPRGRITAADVRAQIDAAESERAPEEAVSYDVEPLSKLRRTVAERMVASAHSAPRFDLEIEIDVNEVVRWRSRYSGRDEETPSYTAILIRVVSRALTEHPRLNSTFVDGELRLYRDVNVGVAVATSEGLLVPVIRRAEELTLAQIQETVKELRSKARRQKFSSTELEGGTFTLSNLGMYGIDAFRAIINPPEAAILAVGQIRERPIAIDGEVVVRPVMRAVLSADHRAVDGAEAAAFLASIRRYLENPYHLL